LSVTVRTILVQSSVGFTRVKFSSLTKEKEMQKSKTPEVDEQLSDQGPQSNCGDQVDSMDLYWEKLRMDRQFSRWQKPATD